MKRVISFCYQAFERFISLFFSFPLGFLIDTNGMFYGQFLSFDFVHIWGFKFIQLSFILKFLDIINAREINVIIQQVISDN